VKQASSSSVRCLTHQKLNCPKNREVVSANRRCLTGDQHWTFDRSVCTASGISITPRLPARLLIYSLETAHHAVTPVPVNSISLDLLVFSGFLKVILSRSRMCRVHVEPTLAVA
jgi:hypothetical protein